MTQPLHIPLSRPTIDEETIAGVAEVLRSGWITSGPMVKKLEQALSTRFAGRPVRCFNSATAALEVALRIAKVGPGDEVITTPLSWVATSNVVLTVGARPVFVDIDPITRNIDLNAVDAALTSATKAIIPVDLAGLPVNRNELYAIAAKNNLRVIEDAAQSMGSSWSGKEIGSFGDLIAFSFHPNKNITTIEGGCLVLPDEAAAGLAEQYRLQGVVRSGMDGMEVECLGGKFNLTDVAARVGLGQLGYLEAFNAKRRALVRYYFECLQRPEWAGISIGLPFPDFEQSNWNMFQVVLPKGENALTRGEVMERLRELGVGSGVHYPPIHLFQLYRRLGWKEGDFPHAEQVGRSILTLPLFPEMTIADVERVSSALLTILNDAES